MTQAQAKGDGSKNQQLAKTIDPATTIRTMLEKNRQAISAALPDVVKADRFIRIALTTCQRTPRLLQADARSLIGAIVEAAQVGLVPDNILGEGYLIPFWNKKRSCYEVQFMPGYKGYIKLAHRSGEVSNVFARVVYENEPFKILHGLKTRIHHQPLPPSSRGEKRIGAYAVAQKKDGSTAIEFLWEDEIMAIRERSRAKDEGPWVTDPDEMVKKTAIRRLAKVLPLSTEWSRVAALDEAREAGIPTPSDMEAEGALLAEYEGFSPPAEIPKEKEPEKVPFPKEEGKTEEKEKPAEGRQPGEDNEPEEESGKTAFVPNAARKILQSGTKAKQNRELGSISDGQVKMIGAVLGSLGCKKDDERHIALSVLLGVDVKSTKDLSSAEASAVIDVLKEMEAGSK